MKKTALLICLLIIGSFCYSQTKRPVNTLTKSTISTVFKGVKISNGKLVARQGYEFVVSADGLSAVLQRKSSDEIEGKFYCFCSGFEAGTCSVSTSPSSVSCEAGTCNSKKCFMAVTIPGKDEASGYIIQTR